ncbi:hypothetical protein BNJ_00210 [Kaumoebavirus]|uniref:hypothetical protein n=1 Tax=Kaumoebavirus TaxID=1859492 RepID=UPI0009C2DC6C|nr:hypothetical protein BNJ_00210 [Kaumoebavirus]ARA72039.1 hypothetical protein BNJ_00210 [Kaumoebavirus]
MAADYFYDNFGDALAKDYPELNYLASSWNDGISSVTIYKDDEVMMEIDVEKLSGRPWDVVENVIEEIDRAQAGIKAYCRVESLEKEVKELRELVRALLYAPGSPEYLEAKARFEGRQN